LYNVKLYHYDLLVPCRLSFVAKRFSLMVRSLTAQSGPKLTLFRSVNQSLYYSVKQQWKQQLQRHGSCSPALIWS